MTDRQLSKQHAYLAMYVFLEQRFRNTQSGDIAALLGSMSFLPGGEPADPAVAKDWDDAVNQSVGDEVMANLDLK